MKNKYKWRRLFFIFEFLKKTLFEKIIKKYYFKKLFKKTLSNKFFFFFYSRNTLKHFLFIFHNLYYNLRKKTCYSVFQKISLVVNDTIDFVLEEEEKKFRHVF